MVPAARALGAVALLGAVVLGVVAPHRARAAASDARDVRTVYLGDCATCHGSRAQGTSRGPDLRRAGPAAIDYMVSTGRMPIDDPDEKVERHTPAYSPPMIRRLVDYVASLGTGGPDIPRVAVSASKVADGGELYRAQCAACHSWAGAGGALLGRNAPPLTESSPRVVAEAVRVGPGAMPAFGPAALNDDELDAVVSYVTKELQHPDDRGGQALWHLGPLAEGGVAWVAGIGALILAIRWIGEAR